MKLKESDFSTGAADAALRLPAAAAPARRLPGIVDLYRHAGRQVNNVHPIERLEFADYEGFARSLTQFHGLPDAVRRGWDLVLAMDYVEAPRRLLEHGLDVPQNAAQLLAKAIADKHLNAAMFLRAEGTPFDDVSLEAVRNTTGLGANYTMLGWIEEELSRDPARNTAYEDVLLEAVRGALDLAETTSCARFPHVVRQRWRETRQWGMATGFYTEKLATLPPGGIDGQKLEQLFGWMSVSNQHEHRIYHAYWALRVFGEPGEALAFWLRHGGGGWRGDDESFGCFITRVFQDEIKPDPARAKGMGGFSYWLGVMQDKPNNPAPPPRVLRDYGRALMAAKPRGPFPPVPFPR